MHGCSSTSVPIVNAEVDSMGRVVEGGVGIANRTSPLKAAIEKVQAEIRQEYGVRDERKRELEFLERGGNPLDFKLGNGASVSVQSTSITDLHPDQIVTSEAKGSFAFTASPHGDSVESSGRPGATPCEPNSADNLMLFDAEQELSEGGRSFLHPSRSAVVPSDQSFQIDGNHKTKEHGDTAAFGLPRKAYKRRYRSRPNRDGARSGSMDVNPTRGYHASSIPSRHGPRDAQGLVSDTENQHISLDPKPTSSIDGTLHKTVSADGQHDMELDGLKSVESTKDLIKGVPVDATLDVIASINSHDEQGNQQSLSGPAKTPNQIGSSRLEAIQATEEMNSAIVGCQTSVTDTKVENKSSSCQINGFCRKGGDEKTNDAQNSSAPCSINMLGSESSCTRTSLSIAGKNDIEMCTGTMNVDSNGDLKNRTSEDVTPAIESDKFVKEKKDTAGTDSSTLVNKETACHIQQENGFRLQPEEESERDKYAFISEVKDKVIEVCGSIRSESGRKSMDPLVENTGPQIETSYDVRRQDCIDVSDSGLHDSRFLPRVSNVSTEAQTSSGPDSRFASKIDEDSILKEAKIIEAKRKRIAELSIVTNPTEIRWKSHWNYVLEEMAWLANDFAQERIWKIAAAAQISFRVAVTCRLRKQEGSGMVAETVAHTLAKAVMEFWHAMDTNKELEQRRQKNGAVSVQAYAVRFLKYNKHNVMDDQADVPLTPDRISDSGILDQSYSWEDNLTEENLFYTVPTGAMTTYRKSIESLVAQCERNGVATKEEVETSACDVAAESQDNAFDEDEGETSTYNMSVVFEGSKSSGYGQKKRKHLTHAYGARSYEMGSDLLPMHCAENKVVTQQSALLTKRPGGSLNVSIPTKRVRTASRRVIGPFNAGSSGFQMPNKTDASSGDTNSFQDDQSTLRGGLVVPNSLEVESAADFEKQLPFESAEVSTKPKKKKKAKHLSATYEQRWQVDSSFQNEQFPRDHLKKRSDSHQLEYNGNTGLLGQPMIKKPKIMRQSQDNSFDNMPPSGGSVPSPVASQISNMSNPNKFIKMLGGRDRGRKAKAVKMPSGQPGSGSPWSLFEDQALVVLAHDLGPNWELVSDAINSTLHFKCIFRKAKECKERHNFLMDRTSGDGADSAEDSGSSQPYPSTLPGIPKGSARQLFQRLQGPMEEDMLKSHFEKIIMIGQKQRHRKTQDPRQLQQPHSSHTTALSQVCPNNLNGGPILTPLDLCDPAISGPDILSLGYQGPHSSGLAIPNQGTLTPMLPASGASSVLQGSPNMMIGSNFSSSPGPLSSSASRDARYVVPRSGSVSADEQQRVQQYNQMIPGRNIPQPNISVPGAVPGTDRGVRILPGANGMGMMPGVNRGMPMARPGLQGIPSSSMVNSGSMVSPGMSSANMHTGVGASQGSSMLRPREALHMMRPGPSQDSQRQMMVPDLQMPGNGQGMSQFGGLSSPFPNQSASPPVSSYPVHHQPSHPISPQQPQVLSPHHPHFQGSANHGPSPQQQAYAIRLAKERHLQQRLLQQQPQQQQQQFAASNSLMPHVQSQPQLPISSAMQNSSQVKAQTSSPPVSLSPLTSTPMNSMPQHQQKHQTPTQGAVRNAQALGSGLSTQTSKQRQRQQHQLSQANRQHPQQRQQLQAQQQAKFAKGVGRGNLMMHQNIPTESSVLNGVSTNPGNQCSEKGEPATHLVQNQGLYTTTSALNTVQPTRHATSQSPSQSLPQQKMYSSQGSSSSKHLQMTSQSDSSCQGQVPPVAPPVLSTGPQSGPSAAIAGSNHLQAPPHQKLLNQHQSARVVQTNRQINSDPSTKPQGRDPVTDQHPTISSADMDTMTALPQTCNTATNVVQIVSPPSAHQRHASEPLLDSNALNSPANLSPSVSMPSNSSESVPQGGKGLAQRPSASLPTRNDVSAQWQKQHQSQGQQPHSPVPPPQQPPVHTQQQAQLLQAGNGNLYGRSSDPDRKETPADCGDKDWSCPCRVNIPLR
ncbi:Chromatin modification-related protein EAF1 A [Sesamum alatum]|uniref:Chromatin modification-related protein EAF1 A n=1 Tax=Sesamum alatum TaxID=300844 RepID=A0AAE1Z1Y0_9LAMI|nr:Chromatin modification-related protein EAF1 A [Sesamum alatum]